MLSAMRAVAMSGKVKCRIVRHAMAVAALLLAVAGCGGSYNASVKGVVTLDNSPLPRGTVTFTPQQSGPSGYGLVDSDGSYSIKIGLGNGLPSGQYVVTVATNEKSVANANPALPPAPGKPVTPVWYRDPTQSPLKYTVNPGKNEINLELKSQPPAGWKPTGRK